MFTIQELLLPAESLVVITFLLAASLHYKPQLSVKSLTVHNFYFGEGSDITGVPTKMLTVNCSMRMTVHNPASFFGIYVSSKSVNLMYSEVTVATGELKKYHQQLQMTCYYIWARLCLQKLQTVERWSELQRVIFI
ncbi:hypothetical protein KIW84_014067 [Lathyrus oleraceus]|uniref:Late embryogenesis abundant protein LEA-2 subgroup domain-containing protein n=1 Tax=Pisum sativum TaxID=3888 RepID=A0A9D5BMC7_PEA|nr:hypothetical protein KIW84_014067 [Pisum sativum]